MTSPSQDPHSEVSQPASQPDRFTPSLPGVTDLSQEPTAVSSQQYPDIVTERFKQVPPLISVEGGIYGLVNNPVSPDVVCNHLDSDDRKRLAIQFTLTENPLVAKGDLSIRDAIQAVRQPIPVVSESLDQEGTPNSPIKKDPGFGTMDGGNIAPCMHALRQGLINAGARLKQEIEASTSTQASALEIDMDLLSLDHRQLANHDYEGERAVREVAALSEQPLSIISIGMGYGATDVYALRALIEYAIKIDDGRPYYLDLVDPLGQEFVSGLGSDALRCVSVVEHGERANPPISTASQNYNPLPEVGMGVLLRKELARPDVQQCLDKLNICIRVHPTSSEQFFASRDTVPASEDVDRVAAVIVDGDHKFDESGSLCPLKDIQGALDSNPEVVIIDDAKISPGRGSYPVTAVVSALEGKLAELDPLTAQRGENIPFKVDWSPYSNNLSVDILSGQAQERFDLPGNQIRDRAMIRPYDENNEPAALVVLARVWVRMKS
jgi:hypothetical protein